MKLINMTVDNFVKNMMHSPAPGESGKASS